MDYVDSTLGTNITEHAGFPNPATDTSIVSLDITKLLVKHPSSTFFMQLSGNTWEEQGIYHGDIIVIDRSLGAEPKDLVVWWDGDEFRVSYCRNLPKGTSTWGVITNIIHRYRT
jgi:DNA polymerase V